MYTLCWSIQQKNDWSTAETMNSLGVRIIFQQFYTNSVTWHTARDASTAAHGIHYGSQIDTKGMFWGDNEGIEREGETDRDRETDREREKEGKKGKKILKNKSKWKRGKKEKTEGKMERKKLNETRDMKGNRKTEIREKK